MASFLKTGLSKATAVTDQVTGKKGLQEELDAEKAAHAETKEELEATQKELANIKAALEQAELDLTHERQISAELQANLNAIEYEKMVAAYTEEMIAAEKAAADAELAQMSEEMKQKALGDAALIYEAMSGLTVNDKKIASAIGPNNGAQCQTLKAVYLSNYGKELTARIQKHTSGNFRTYCLAMLDTVPEYQAKLIEEAIGLVSTDTDVIVEVLAPLTVTELNTLKAEYNRLYKKDLANRVTAGTSGDISEFLAILLTGARETGGADAARLEADCKALYQAGQGKTIGSDKQPFMSILGNRSPAHIAAINEAYKTYNKKGVDLVTAVNKCFGSYLAKAFEAVILSSISPAAYYAFRAEKAMAGIGCDDLMLMRVLITRRDVDMDEIKAAYSSMYNQDFSLRVKDELSGNLRRVALLSIGSPVEA